MNLTLASASPRRRELLERLGVDFEIRVTDGEERAMALPPALLAALPPCPVTHEHHPTMLAWKKVLTACADASPGVIIGADTIVVRQGEVLNKPRDAAHARAMLAQLSGVEHTVYTGLAVLVMPPHAASAAADRALVLEQGLALYDLVGAQVSFAKLSEDEIAGYVATGEPMDKAGAYGVQGLGGRLVQRVVGSYTAVVGLPLPATVALLRQAGVRVPVEPSDAYYLWLQAQGKEPLPCPPTLP